LGGDGDQGQSTHIVEHYDIFEQLRHKGHFFFEDLPQLSKCQLALGIGLHHYHWFVFEAPVIKM
jgi:hypothetical protein